MILTVNGFTELLDEFISSNYEFRRNQAKKIIGKETLEYRRTDKDSWNPFSSFIYKEKRHIVKSTDGESADLALNAYPDWLIKKVALQKSETAQDFIEKESYLQIMEEAPTQITGVKPVSTAKREPVLLDEGEKCYISFGMKKSFFKKYYVALPGVVESVVHQNGDLDYYSVFILKYNKSKGKVEYFGRHMVMHTELGRTPEEAVKNVAYSQAIY